MIKQEHQGFGHNINVEGDFYNDILQKYPTILAEIVNVLGEKLLCPSEKKLMPSFDPFDIEDKLNYNCIKRYKEIFDEYKVYQGKLDIIYRELDEQGSHKKEIFLRNIRDIYLKIKGKYLKKNNNLPIEKIICENSDNIIEEIEKELKKEIDKSDNIRQYGEVISQVLWIIIVDGILRCKILEEPPKNDPF